MISENDLQFLAGFRDTQQGFVARAEYAQMARIPAQVIDSLVLGRIYGGK
jgi:hypothetical protein